MLCVKCKSKRAYYSLDGEKAAFCCDCRQINMINTLTKRCDTCKSKIPSYNFCGLKAKFCKDCKLDGMQNVANHSMMCKKCGLKRASFSSNSKSRPELCASCSGSEKNNISKIVNVVIKKCIICKQKPAKYSDNVSNHTSTKYTNKSSAKYCNDCRNNDSINVRKNLCTTCKQTIASFNYKNKPARYCSSCKSEDMENVKNTSSKCHNCLKTRMNPQYKPYCARCSKIVNIEKN